MTAETYSTPQAQVYDPCGGKQPLRKLGVQKQEPGFWSREVNEMFRDKVEDLGNLADNT